MSTIKTFSVVLSDDRRENDSYSPGEKLSGIVQLDLFKELKLNSLKLDIYGRAKVNW